MLRLKQHGLRSPALSFEHVTSILRLRVSDCLVERIQRIQSQRAIGVISIHRVYTCGAAARAIFKSSDIVNASVEYEATVLAEYQVDLEKKRHHVDRVQKGRVIV